MVCGVANPIDGINTQWATMHTDGRHVTQRNIDGSVHVYDCNSGTEVLSGAYVDDELVIMNKNGYFDGSDDATEYVEMRVPGLRGRHIFSQFARSLKHPGI